jgi:hypothetical protein
MKIKVKRPVEIEVFTVYVMLPVRHEDEDMPYDFPLRRGDIWEAFIDIDTGKISGWPEGRKGGFYMKVCDSGVYRLISPDGEITERNDYVPHGLIPGDYGDYVQFEINEQGIITNWPKTPDVSCFFQDEED